MFNMIEQFISVEQYFYKIYKSVKICSKIHKTLKS